ncbi:TetR/AcrR family transcriptional regulator [Amycolatopsis benzoatilytica]|uniref:TetR/AcrR family transcriptional regulator n=1 Tax=Amycolatopsis benzoatilytica TaxID=346045 RepID=UPI0003742BAE|nr:TetR/AcrR family transcriptional regulator [Amycolatopsis benzoatilytica]
MARWEGNTRGRLEQAALELFEEQGYDRTTVAQIAQRANLTERSFYRWFSDKREVLFGGSQELEAEFVSGIEAAAPDAGALPTLLAAFATAPRVFRPREFLVRRAAVIAANPPLHERELIKLVSISQSLTEALLRRGVDPDTARMATDLGLSVLRLATERWMAAPHPDPKGFPEALSVAAAELLAVASDGLSA